MEIVKCVASFFIFCAIIVSCAIILGMWTQHKEITDVKILNEINSNIIKYKNDYGLNKCAKLIFDKNIKITWESKMEYEKCISKTKLIYIKQNIRQHIDFEDGK